jgi:hypothetical protein
LPSGIKNRWRKKMTFKDAVIDILPEARDRMHNDEIAERATANGISYLAGFIPSIYNRFQHLIDSQTANEIFIRQIRISDINFQEQKCTYNQASNDSGFIQNKLIRNLQIISTSRLNTRDFVMLVSNSLNSPEGGKNG